MELLVVGSVALDSLETPFGSVTDALGGSAVHFSLAASLLHPVRVVGVVGDDYPMDQLEILSGRGIDWSGVVQGTGESFRWKGKYSFDLSSRETLETRLGVFADFRPVLQPEVRKAQFVFLGNIDPELQLEILDQLHSPRLVAADTMNFWIDTRKEALLELLTRIDLLILNDSEARQLSGDWNVHRAGRWLLEHGPARVIIKQGEFGALLLEPGRTFHVPAFPLEEVFDPTGAGDAFAGGVMGYLAARGSVDTDTLRRAMVYGATMGSFAVSGFGIDGLKQVEMSEVDQRVARFTDLTRVPLAPRLDATSTPGSSLYAAAGVDLIQADSAKQQIGLLVEGTRTELSLGEIGAFGGMVRVPDGINQPVLVLSTDGVGTKVLVAMQAGRFDTVGEDLVNHSINDILVHGACPIAFLDYIAGHRLPVPMIAAVVEGIARACTRQGIALAGGETAAMPGVYSPGTFDLAGTIIGVAEEEELLHGDRVRPGDILIAYGSSGLHTNGYTLARHVLFDLMGLSLSDLLPGTDTTVADALLAVHLSYREAITPVLKSIHALAHITGGGIAGNLVRVLPPGTAAEIHSDSWEWPVLFRVIAEGGGVSEAEMRDVFNLGVGMVAITPSEQVERVQAAASAAGIKTWKLGEIIPGDPQVQFTS